MLARVFSSTLYGFDAKVVEVQVDVSSGIPATFVVGLADTSIKESKERVRSCLRNLSLFKYPLARIAINLAPADLFKYGTQFDIGIALGILLASGQIYFESRDKLFLGELSLDGKIRPVKGVLAMVIAARDCGIREIFLPVENVAEAQLIRGIEIIPAASMHEVVSMLTGSVQKSYGQVRPFTYIEPVAEDFSGIADQDFAKRGLVIAAAGGHNILLNGSPGSGKTMLARAMPSILPSPNPEQILEIVKINSMAGLTKESRISPKPFRNPHHSVTLQAFIGGGKHPRPGEISLAHNGILFLDEFPEFPRQIIESLRQPLENKYIRITRSSGDIVFPAKFILIAAKNPCPCGYYQDSSKECVCTLNQIISYNKKISGPILDRIDLNIFVHKVDLKKLHNGDEKTSSSFLAEVQAAREMQYHRYGSIKLNNQADSKDINNRFALDGESMHLLGKAAEKFELSARSYFRLIKVSRTIADLSQSESVLSAHVAEAIQYRL